MPAKYNYAIKGEKHFHNISDDTLESYKDMIQQLIYNYPVRDDPEIYQSLCTCLQDVTLELLDRASKVSVKPKTRAQIKSKTSSTGVKIPRNIHIKKLGK